MADLSDLLAERKAERSKSPPSTMKIDRILKALKPEDATLLLTALQEPDPTQTREYDYSSTDIAESLAAMGFSISPTSVRRWRQRENRNNLND